MAGNGNRGKQTCCTASLLASIAPWRGGRGASGRLASRCARGTVRQASP